jgi:hypothetical protein
MGKPNTLEKTFLLFAFMCLVMSYFFVQDKLTFKVGFYLFTVLILLSVFTRYRKLLSVVTKILLCVFILTVFFVIIAMVWFPASDVRDIRDIATFSILLFAFSFNKSTKKIRT